MRDARRPAGKDAAPPDNGAVEASLEDIFQTDPISALGLPPPVSIGRTASVGAALKAVQQHRMGYVLVVDADGRPAGLMSEREVLMKIVARDVKYDESVDTYMSAIEETLTARAPIADAIAIMKRGCERNIPVVDAMGRAVAVLRTLDIIHFLAEAFPAKVLNLPPRPHQMIPEPEGA